MTNHGICVPVGLGVCSFCAANVDRAIAARDATTNTAVRILVPTGTVCRNGRNEIAGMSDGMGRHRNGRLLGDLRDFRDHGLYRSWWSGGSRNYRERSSLR